MKVLLPVTADLELLNISASQYGVLWVPMTNFYINHFEKNAIRLSCSYLTSMQIEEGVHRLTSFFRDL